MRPCFCDHCDPAGPYDLEQCRLCWLYHHSPRYRALWDGQPIPKARTATQKVLGFVAASIQHARRGLPVVSDEVYGERMRLCGNCTEYEAAKDRCRLCGCGLKKKARWADQACPAGVWIATV